MQKIVKFVKIASAIILFLIVLFFIPVIYNMWRLQTGRLIKWNGVIYTKAEYEQYVKDNPQYYPDVPAKNTPEEVYAKYREALLKNDIEGAMQYVRFNDRDEKIKSIEENGLELIKKSLPEKIRRSESSNEKWASYYSEDPNIAMGFSFEKNPSGYWELR